LNTLILIKLGQIYRMELLGTTAMMELSKNFYAREINENLLRFGGMHGTNLEGLAEIFLELNYTPGDDIAIPANVEELLKQREIPDRLLFDWLDEFETELEKQYQKFSRFHEMNPKNLPVSVWKKLETVRHRQESVAKEISEIKSRTTEILNTAAWRS